MKTKANTNGKIAVVTGAASGIGLATSKLMARRGNRVLMVDRTEDALARACAALRDEGFDVESISADLSRSDGASAAIEYCGRVFGGLDILISGAGINPRGTILETSDELLDEVLATNLKATAYLARSAIPMMIERSGGAIVTVSSINGLVAWKNEAAYEAAKGGLVMLTKSLAVDYAEEGIRANCVCPGVTGTPMLERTVTASAHPDEFRQSLASLQPIPRIGTPEDVAYAIAFLASDEAAYITGSVLPVDGGYTAV